MKKLSKKFFYFAVIFFSVLAAVYFFSEGSAVLADSHTVLRWEKMNSPMFETYQIWGGSLKVIHTVGWLSNILVIIFISLAIIFGREAQKKI